MSRFCPNNFKPNPKNISWAVEKFKIDVKEVEGQVELMIDHEFKRSYTDWQKVFRNWMRTADKHNLLKRERVPRTVEVLSEEQRVEDARKGWETLNRLKAVK